MVPKYKKNCTSPRLPLSTFMNLHFIPDPTPKDGDNSKFQQFDEIYGTHTDEIYHPSYVNNVDEPIKGLLVKEKVRSLINCVNCLKPCVVYSDAKRYKADCHVILPHIEELHYTCGSPLLPEEHRLHSLAVVRQKFDVCIYCGSLQNLQGILANLKESFRMIYPLCNICANSGETFFTRLQLGGKKRKLAE